MAGLIYPGKANIFSIEKISDTSIVIVFDSTKRKYRYNNLKPEIIEQLFDAAKEDDSTLFKQIFNKSIKNNIEVSYKEI